MGGSTAAASPNAARKPGNNHHVEIRVRGFPMEFRKGEVWLPYEKAYRDKGFAFTLGNISAGGMYYYADIDAAWMRIEKAFLGPEEGARVKACTGIEYVLVKKHELLPESGSCQNSPTD